MQCKTGTFTSLHFVLSLSLLKSLISQLSTWPASLFLPLHEYQEKSHKRDRYALLSVIDSWLLEGEVLESFLSMRGLDTLRQLACSSTYRNVQCSFPAMHSSAKFFPRHCEKHILRIIITSLNSMIEAKHMSQQLNFWNIILLSLHK